MIMISRRIIYSIYFYPGHIAIHGQKIEGNVVKRDVRILLTKDEMLQGYCGTCILYIRME